MSQNRRTRRLVRGALWALAAAHLAEAMVLRRRRERLAALYNPGTPHDIAGKLGLISAEGADVDGDTLAATAHEMELDGVEVVDLVPGDLPAERALRLLRRVNPEQLTEDIVYAPGGAHEALVLHPSVAERMQVDPREQTDDRHAMVRRTVKAQRYAPTTAVLRVAPHLKASPYGPLDRWRELEGVTAAARPFVSLSPVIVGAHLAQLAALAAGVVVAPTAALVALAAWSAKPALVFGAAGTDASAGGTPSTPGSPGTAESNGEAEPRADGTALRPPDVVDASLLRFPRLLVDAVSAAVVGRTETLAAKERRLAEPSLTPPPADQLFGERRDDCPWCGSTDLVGRVDVPDLFHSKPGEFHLDECRGCGHIFQNPQVTPAGLDYYYAEFYEGLGEETWEMVFAGGMKHNGDRLDAIEREAKPARWLDVGTGHGHFCLAARQRFPETRFEGVDMSDTVLEAQRRGRIDVAHVGLFIELADELPRTYDVVSMHHYMEHTLDPKPELAAAAKVLAPGGLLMVEVPDPSTPWATRLGRFWFYYVQPQHLHFVRCEELVKHLESEGFEVVSVERSEATLGFDLSGPVLLKVQHLARSPHMPWLPLPTLGLRLKRLAVTVGAVPVLLAAAITDLVISALPPAGGVGNAYRVVARKAYIPEADVAEVAEDG